MTTAALQQTPQPVAPAKHKFKTHAYVKPKAARDSLRFQFIFGGTPDDWKPGKNITGNLTVTYMLPYDPQTFCLAALRTYVEAEHDNNIRLAHRLGNESKRNEHILIAKLSIESVRGWFKSQTLDAEEFHKAVCTAVDCNHTVFMDCVGLREKCRLSITAQHLDSLI